MQFNPCSSACTQNGTHCGGCGRSHDEIAGTRALIDAIAQFAVKMGYENADEFTGFIAMKAAGKARALKAAAA